MFFIIFSVLHHFRITVSSLECIVHSLKLWEEGESKNWPFESQIRKEMQTPHTITTTKGCCGDLALWGPEGPLVVTLRKGSQDFRYKSFLCLCSPGFQQSTRSSQPDGFIARSALKNHYVK